MLLNLSWRNVWRNKLRSLVVMGAIIVGSWAVIFMSSFSTGMIMGFINNSILHEVSHIQLHQEAYLKDQEIKYFISNPEPILEKLLANENVESATYRSLANGMISSNKSARGIQIKGIVPNKEATITKLNELVVEGDYLTEGKKNPILISKRIAEKLKLKLRSKLVLTFQDYKGEIAAGAFRVVGLFDSGNNPFDEANCFINLKDLNRLLGPPVNLNVNPDLANPPSSLEISNSQKTTQLHVHELAVYLKSTNSLAVTTASLQKEFPSLKVQNYREISPDVELFENQIKISTTIFMVIIMLALIFGIINTMLMAVLERYRELGVLMAVGMGKAKIFTMIVLETLMIALVATPVGLLVGYFSVKFFVNRGIDLSAFSAGMRQFGMAEIVYPVIDTGLYWQLAMAVGITAILASLYPAYKAVKLKPLEAIRKL